MEFSLLHECWFHQFWNLNLPIFLTYFCSDFFFNWQTEKKKTVLDQSEICFLFQLLKLRTIHGTNRGRVTNWWKHPMNSLRQKNCRANEKMQGEEKNWQDNRNRKWLLKQWQNENIACNKKAVRKTYFPCNLHPVA